MTCLMCVLRIEPLSSEEQPVLLITKPCLRTQGSEFWSLLPICRLQVPGFPLCLLDPLHHCLCRLFNVNSILYNSESCDSTFLFLSSYPCRLFSWYLVPFPTPSLPPGVKSFSLARKESRLSHV